MGAELLHIRHGASAEHIDNARPCSSMLKTCLCIMINGSARFCVVIYWDAYVFCVVILPSGCSFYVEL